MKAISKTILATTALATVLSLSAAPTAEARDYRGHRGGGSNTGAYIGLGLGLAALGGALAYSATRDYPPAYYYAPPPAYYYPPPQAYYAPPAYGYAAPAPTYYSYSYDPYAYRITP